MRRYVLFLPVFTALMIVVIATAQRSASVRAQLGRINTKDWLETIRRDSPEVAEVPS